MKAIHDAQFLALMFTFLVSCAFWSGLIVLFSLADGMREGLGWPISLGQAIVLSGFAAFAGLCCGLAGALAFRAPRGTK